MSCTEDIEDKESGVKRALVGLVAGSVLAAVGTAPGEPLGNTTLEETIITTGTGFHTLKVSAGERHTVRSLPGAKTAKGRSSRRRSLAYFGQLTDTHVTDEMSPARVDFVDPLGGIVDGAWRPQEAFTLQSLDQFVRNINANRTSSLAQAGGSHADLDLVVTTGDLTDNQQYNEFRWLMQVMRGDRVDPFSGKEVSDGNPCPGITAAERVRIRKDVAQRRYTGVQDYSDYPDQSRDRYEGFWDPNIPVRGGKFNFFPRYDGLMDRAQQPFDTAGLKVPWFISRGNHDGLVQGNLAATSLLRTFVTGCVKVLPNAALNPSSFGKITLDGLRNLLEDREFLAQLVNNAMRVAPDPDRRFISEIGLKKLTGGAHGFSFVDRKEAKSSKNAAGYYAWTPKPGLRLISIDTVAEGGNADGNLDNPQYRWLKRELDRNSSTEYDGRGRLVTDDDPDRLIVLLGHHPLSGMNVTTPDEAAGLCSEPDQPGCDADPRNSEPIHRGTKGEGSVENLLLRYPNMIAYVNGHFHRSEISQTVRSGGSTGFWNISTASHVDFPQQGRLIELMDNRDGTLSIFTTMINNASPIKPPAESPSSEQVSSFSDAEVASISRQISANDGQPAGRNGGSSGQKRDRNTELVLRNPLAGR